MLAGFAGFVERSSSANGSSCVVSPAAHEEMARTSSALLATTGATGFIGGSCDRPSLPDAKNSRRVLPSRQGIRAEFVSETRILEPGGEIARWAP